jgi:putative hydrolase of the HAD superfamily
LISRRDISVTFDLWETLIADRSELDVSRGWMRCKGLHEVLKQVGVEISLNDINRAYEETDILLDAAWRREENPTLRDQIELIINRATGGKVAMPNDPEAIRLLERAYVDPILVSPPKLKTDAASVLQGVHARVNNVGLISNTGRSPASALRELLSRYGILRYFDSTIFSDEFGVRKPDRRIFEKAAQLLHADASKIVHVGDNPEADIWGAKQAGMRAVLLEYPVPADFLGRPTSLFSLSRIKHTSSREVKPDATIKSLGEVVGYIDSL